MKILLLHPDDYALGPRTEQHWDQVIDLGRCGKATRNSWAKAFECPVSAIDDLRDGFAEVRRVRDVLRRGLGYLVDKEGIDWWELLATLEHQALETLVILEKFTHNTSTDVEVFTTRDCFEARALKLLLRGRASVLPGTHGSRKGLKYYSQRLWRLPAKEVAQILGDKYDTAYNFRRYLHRTPSRSSGRVVLVPTSYVNVSRMGCAYAQVLAERQFLLVATRQSGRLSDLPGNVRQEWLASYAGSKCGEEVPVLMERWSELRSELASIPVLSAAFELGLMHDFRTRLSVGMAIRDLWRRVIESEPIEAVLCCDDFNPHTHIPLLLARKRNVPTIACHHGALDGRLLIKKNHADVILAKGRMEYDYLVHLCGVDAKVEIGAPTFSGALDKSDSSSREWIVFFSEVYETTKGRTEEVYRDVLPALVEVARRAGKQLVIKLHPSENLRDRQGTCRNLISSPEYEAIRWLRGKLNAELLARAWAAVTVQSSAVVECTLAGVPCFRCDWLEMGSYGYATQFEKFGVGAGMSSPAELASIPERLPLTGSGAEVVKNCWQEISSERFRELLEGKQKLEPSHAI